MADFRDHKGNELERIQNREAILNFVELVSAEIRDPLPRHQGFDMTNFSWTTPACAIGVPRDNRKDREMGHESDETAQDRTACRTRSQAENTHGP